MPTRSHPRVLPRLRQVLSRQQDLTISDAALLDRYLCRRDEQAFAALVQRHGPMVLGVCRRVLRNDADADDAFQATFLVFVVKAASLRGGVIGNFLYGVAYNTARKAQAMNRTRRAKEAAKAVAPPPPDPVLTRETQAVIDAELAALPEKYRSAIVACDLEGRSIKDAAAQLGLPQGTLATRLRRGRALLATRLQARGVGLAPGLLATPALPVALATATIDAGLRVAGLGVTAGGVSAPVALLVEGVLKSMLVTKLKLAAIAFAVAFLGLSGSLLSQSSAPLSKAAASAVKAEGNLTETLLALDRHLWESSSRGDWQEREKFLADEYASTSARGRFGKADSVAADKRVRCKDWAIRDAKVTRVSTDVAVLAYEYDCKVVSNDGQELEARKGHRVSYVWANRNGGWVLVYGHDESAPPRHAATEVLLRQGAATRLQLQRRDATASALLYLANRDLQEVATEALLLQLRVPQPVGQWAVEFSNGVKQVATFGKDGAVTVAEPTRKAKGKADAKDGAIVVKYEDGRVERWARTGNRMVVEHWFPATEYPAGRPTLGTAELHEAAKTEVVPLKHVLTTDAVNRLTREHGVKAGAVVPEPITNQLLIVGTEEVRRMIKAALQKIDVAKP